MTSLSTPDTATSGASVMVGAPPSPSIHPSSVAQSGLTGWSPRLMYPTTQQQNAYGGPFGMWFRSADQMANNHMMSNIARYASMLPNSNIDWQAIQPQYMRGNFGMYSLGQGQPQGLPGQYMANWNQRMVAPNGQINYQQVI